MTYIPQEKIDEIRDRIDIVQLISGYVPLKKRGRNHIGLCPFHSEKTPSFTVSEEKQIYHCFGCGEGGNAFAFMMKHDNLDFPEAIRILAERTGVEISEHESSESRERDSFIKSLFEANTLAEQFFHDNLMKDPRAKPVREYLRDRGMEEEMVKVFQLGYADRSGESLQRFLSEKGVSTSIAQKAGLVRAQSDNRPAADTFRGRVIFPIRDTRGRPVGFGGRIMGEGQPKYLNTPETPLFKKGETLYGLDLSKQQIPKEGFVLVVEGYVDLIALYSGGIRNVVATLGTALTPEHVKRIKRYTKNIYTLFDSDDAGQKAALRSLPVFLNEGVQARVVLLPEGKDPDEIMNKRGSKEMERIIGDSQPLADFYIKEQAKRFDLHDPQGRVAFANEMVPTLKAIRDILERGVYVKMVAEMASVDESVLLSKLAEKPLSASRRGSAPGRSTKERAGRSARNKELHLPGSSQVRAEETLLKILSIHPELYTAELDSVFEEFCNAELKKLGGTLLQALQKKREVKPALLLDNVDTPSLRERLSKLFFTEEEIDSAVAEEMLSDCRRTLQLNRIKNEKKEILKQWRETGSGSENNADDEFSRKWQELEEMERSLKETR